MPRRHFIADLEAAKFGHGLSSIHDVHAGEDDGQVSFLYTHSKLARPVSVTAGVTDLGDYPKSHGFFVFTADDTPESVARIFQDLPSTSSKSVTDLLAIISKAIDKSLSLSNGHTHVNAPLTSQHGASEPEDGSDDEEDFDDYDFDQDLAAGAIGTSFSDTHPISTPSVTFRNRIRQDLRATKAAGFKVGHLGPLLDGHSSFVIVSCTMSKLGISSEAMQAWQVEPADYLVLLIQYPAGYKTDEQLRAYDTLQLRQSMHIRVGTCKKYKPTLQEAYVAFAKGQLETTAPHTNGGLGPDNQQGFKDLFISQPLNDLLNERLVPLLRTRASGLCWSEAEHLYSRVQDLPGHADDPSAHSLLKVDASKAAFPKIVTADHMDVVSSQTSSRFSFPLLAMQFLLRHYVRCTEFCLVCHQQLVTDVEAIKPYVCDRPLCLYQYMSLGFGPSIEHEIVAQPYVVDLLLSFCYASAASGKLKTFPNGLSLSVPPSFTENISATMATDGYSYPHFHPSVATAAVGVKQAVYTSVPGKVRYEPSSREIIFDDTNEKLSPFRVGDWVVIRPDNVLEGPMHSRVIETGYFPSIRLGSAVHLAVVDTGAGAALPSQADPYQVLNAVRPTTSPRWLPVSLEKYEINFDDLIANQKCLAIRNLLHTLPSVKEMREYLVGKRTADLKDWTDRLSPSALGVLRWIIASNRACIVQIGQIGSDAPGKNNEESVYGMKDWVQFRFAMGAPDKEQRFNSAVRDVTSRLKLQHSTLFAWHGSALPNWHSIIREGLHFNDTVNGRAYGLGCYHSLQHATSLGYAGVAHYDGRGTGNTWPPSLLRINCAMALNEIVNAPQEYVSATPHLVVAQLDWIQTRYLFVKCTGASIEYPAEVMPQHVRPQDPSMTPTASTGVKLVVPSASSAVQYSKRKSLLSSIASLRGNKKAKGAPAAVILDEDEMDVVLDEGTDTEDIEILSDEDDSIGDEVALTARIKLGPPKTDFMPGSLDRSTLPKLPSPAYANTASTRRLQADFKALLKVQQKTPLEELGWYMDPERFDNVYQWICELHSFDAFKEKGKDIPLVADMKKSGHISIVLEIRFNGSYPMSPPFVRVVRPRFLGFQQGGGGNVTLGGAMCMELLTNSGWSAVSSIESVLLQVRLAIAGTDPRPARLDTQARGDYGVGEAVEAYKRACRTHGWEIPADFQEMALYRGASDAASNGFY